MSGNLRNAATLTILICSLAITRQSHVNLALGKPTLSSTRPHLSERAADGNRNPNYIAGSSCTHTDQELNPWWSVDLQYRYTVGRVDITNRGDCCSTRLQNVRIGSTDTDPAVTAPSPTNLRICASRDPGVASGATLPFYCTTQGRYLAVLLEGLNTLTLCEVEVFELRDRMRFRQTAESRLVGHVIDSLSVRSKVVCAHECTRNAQCGSFNLQYVVPGSVMQCELNADTSPQQTAADLTAHTQWTFHQGTVILDD